jgi:hypothetical protein
MRESVWPWVTVCSRSARAAAGNASASSNIDSKSLRYVDGMKGDPACAFHLNSDDRNNPRAAFLI